jgi:putative phosphoesterase
LFPDLSSAPLIVNNRYMLNYLQARHLKHGSIAVLSDAHANLPALKAVMADVNRHDVDAFIYAGDLMGGPYPIETIQKLRSLDCFIIRGNSDENVVNYADKTDRTESRESGQWALRRWATSQLDEECLNFLRELPEQLVIRFPNADPIRVVHGSPRRLREMILPDASAELLDEILRDVEEQVLVCGHSHLQWQRLHREILLVNPGAISSPNDGFIGAHYGLLHWDGDHWSATLHRVAYPVDALIAAYQTRGLLEVGGPMARAQLNAVLTGKNGVDAFLRHARHCADEAGLAGIRVISDEIWQQATESFPWCEID